MFFESHAHYDDARYDEDRDEVLKGLKDEGVTKVINVGSSIKGSKRSIELAKKYDYMYAAVGVHPHDVKSLKEDDLERITLLATYKDVVAIGEIGLDYYYDHSPCEIQKLWFREQIEIAKGIGLPVIIHSRDAAQDTYDIIKEKQAYENGGVIHCYSGSVEMALAYIKLGMYIGVGGVVTFSNAKTLKEVVKAIPLTSILLETDCPYLAPMPHRGQRNDSRYLKYIAKEIADIKGVSVEEVARVTYENSVKLFLEDINI